MADFRRLETHGVVCLQVVTANSNRQQRRLEIEHSNDIPPKLSSLESGTAP